jgi:hypothetical protein
MAYVAPPAPAQEQTSSARRGRPSDAWESAVGAVERRWPLVLGGLLLLDLVLLLYMGRGLSFYYDEWAFVVHDYGGGLHALLAAHGGNISVFPIAVYKILFHVVGLNHYAVYRLVLICLHLIAALMVFLLAARRLSRAAALLATALILFLDAAWEDLLWVFQIGYLLSIVGGLASWLMLERRDRRGDVVAMLSLILAAGSSSLGIPIMIGVACELAWQRHWRRAWIVAIPAALYLLWYLGYGENQITSQSLINAPGFAADLVAGAYGGLIGRALEWGRPLAVLGTLLLLVRLLRPAPITPRLVGLLATGIAFWIITALARSTISVPETGRYMYLGAVVIVLAGVELIHERPITPRAIALATPLVAFFAITGLTALHTGSTALRWTSNRVTAELGALEVAARYAPPKYQPDPALAPDITGGPYLHTVRAIGSSPAKSPRKILAAEPDPRAAADRVLFALETPTLAPPVAKSQTRPQSAPVVLLLVSGVQASQAHCLVLRPLPATTMTGVLQLPSGGIEIGDQGATPATFAVRRFGDVFLPLAGGAPAHGAVALSLPPDSLALPWQLQVSSASPVATCRLAG